MALINRRNLLAAGSGVVALAAVSRTSFAQSQPQSKVTGEKEPFTLPALPYAPNALERVIDAETMSLHHGKHHAAYVKNLNEAAKLAPQISEHPIEHVLANLNMVPESVRAVVRNNMGGHANHSMFWQIMSGSGGIPQGDILGAITRDLGGLDKMKADFDAAGARLFGSGWVFVTVSAAGKLAIETTPNQDTPLMAGKRVLFGNDVWEHSYYLRYQNRRADYLRAWWDVVNWTKLSERYSQAKAGTLTI
ncbi:hypothetical protein N185_16050 [Sinorhizobium sp. GW3]|nr:hypothetical protein N185_16050 [Sinorhizobium sp. GW3]